MLPTSSGFHKVSIKENLLPLFYFREKVANSIQHSLYIKTPKKFLEFFTVEHKSEMYIYNDNKDNLIGFISIIFQPHENTLEILSLMISPNSQRRGYGKKLMSFAEELAKKAGLIKTKLVTNIKNIPAVEFYKNIGYKIIKEVKNYYGDGETRYILEKKIG